MSEFRALHAKGRFLVLPNVWDAGTARLAEHAGAVAVATSSAALAWSRGYPDGERIPFDELGDVIRSIVRTVRVPVSVDLESGHVSARRSMRDVARALRDWGVAGVNLEDGAVGCDEAARRIGALREAATELFVNARVDLFLHGSHEDPLSETVKRMAMYERAGADGIFVPGVLDAATIEKLARATSLPLNVWPIRSAPLTTVRDAGARRVTFGPEPCLVAWSAVRARFHAWLGSHESPGLTYPTTNGLFD